jgi:hypothetical protein
MVRYSSTSRSPTIGEWLGRSSDSDSLSIIYQTSASELPIMRLSSEECRRPKPHQRGIWNSPISTTTPQTSVSSVPSPEEQAELTSEPTDSGEERTPSRWGHLV